MFLTLLVWSVMVATVHFSVVFKPRDILAMVADTTITHQNMELGLGRGLAFLPASIIVLAKLIGKLDKSKAHVSKLDNRHLSSIEDLESQV